jgi:hypothetical protein
LTQGGQGRCEAGEERQEVFVSVLTKKQPVNGAAVRATALRGQAVNVARQVGPLAQQTVPVARQGAGNVVEWATPYVDAARSWAAPQIEGSAHAITASLAPAISDALISAAHKIDAPARKSGSHRGLVAGSLLLTAAAGTAALLIIRHRQDANGISAMPATDGEPEGPDADMNGHSRIV